MRLVAAVSVVFLLVLISLFVRTTGADVSSRIGEESSPAVQQSGSPAFEQLESHASSAVPSIPAASHAANKTVSGAPEPAGESKRSRPDLEVVVQRPAGPGGGTASRTTSTGEPTAAEQAAADREEAQDLRRAAQSSARSGDVAGAFEKAARAWALVRQHPDDAKSVRLSREVHGELVVLTRRMQEAQPDPPARFVPLILK